MVSYKDLLSMCSFDKINLYENGKPLGVLLVFQEVCSVTTSFEDMASKN